MTRGIVFYVAGNRINCLIPPALYSLRQFYDGPICFVVDETFSPLIRKELVKQNIVCTQDDLQHPFTTHKTDIWCRKAYHHVGQYAFDTNLYYDLDHVWVDTFDHSIFDMIEEHGLICTSANKEPGGSRWKKLAAEHCIGHVIPYFHGINGGCAGAVKNSEKAQMWVDLIMQTRKHHVLRRNPEEFAMCILKAEGVAGIAPYKWSMPISPKTFQVGFSIEKLDPHLALHCTRGTFTRSEQWRKALSNAYKEDFLSCRTIQTEYNLTKTFIDKMTGANDGD